MGRTVHNSQCGVSYGRHTFTESESTEVLARTLEVFAEESQKLGLEVSWIKTKLQSLNDFLDEPLSPLIAGEEVEVFANFAYRTSAA